MEPNVNDPCPKCGSENWFYQGVIDTNDPLHGWSVVWVCYDCKFSGPARNPEQA